MNLGREIGKAIDDEIARLLQELRDTRMMLAAMVARYGTPDGAEGRARVEITDVEMIAAPREMLVWRTLDPGSIVLAVRKADVGDE